ncbi:MAG: 2,3-bisphosphoglycerate-independent phosphoglycerate mutase [Candidatus Sumerlaeota bacterium]|nr:2,3-bisphosphoglycerate-independent phosphoglycerate mutase [Candidatus Sumerlaeota bacterium]
MSLSLKKLVKFQGRKGPLLLIIMDGVGIGKNDASNAVYMANAPTIKRLFAAPLYTQLQAHGMAVGLPSDDDMGNSEIGHNALGAGRVFDQGAKLVNKAIETGAMFRGEIWRKAIETARAQFRVPSSEFRVPSHEPRATNHEPLPPTLHFIGLHSDGNVHSHTTQLYAMLRQAAKDGVKRCRLHILHDGRDVPAKSALTYIEASEKVLAEINASHPGADFRIASGGGRMITTMDRYQADWTIVERGWKAHVLGQGRPFASATEAVQTVYNEDPKMTDQYMESFVVVKDGKPIGTIEDGDAVVFFNFRGDRAIEITMAFEGGPEFNKFDRVRVPKVFYAGMMQYDGDLMLPENFLVTPPLIERTVCAYLATEKIRMFAVSETQKYGHVTYFWNGNRSGYIDASFETYHEILSDKIQFDQAPKMKALEIADWTERALRTGGYKYGRLNFANGDMVGHTGNFDATVIAVETVDQCSARLINVVNELGGVTLLTADHGNSDEMWTEKKGKREVKTAHTLNPVPFCIVDSGYAGEYRMSKVEKPGLANVAATILNLLGYEAPEEYRPSLIEFV